MKRALHVAKFIAAIFVGSAISYFVIINWGIAVCEVQGRSMEPTYHNKDKVLVKKYVLFYKQPVKGDVVVVRNMEDNKNDIKRIVAVAGDEVIKGGKKYNLNKDQFFILGDNSADSYDSRYYGPVHRVQILGIVE